MLDRRFPLCEHYQCHGRGHDFKLNLTFSTSVLQNHHVIYYRVLAGPKLPPTGLHAVQTVCISSSHNFIGWINFNGENVKKVQGLSVLSFDVIFLPVMYHLSSSVCPRPQCCHF